MAESVEEAIRVTRIVIGGLIAVLALFAIVMHVMAAGAATTDDQLLPYSLFVLVFFGASSSLGYLIQRRRLLAEIRACAPELRQAVGACERVVEPYRRFVIVGGGLIEGPSFLALIVHYLTGSPIPLAVAGLGVLLLALLMPSYDRLKRLVEIATQP